MVNLLCNYDQQRNLLFLQMHRCGTSLMERISQSGQYPELVYLHLNELFGLVDTSKLHRDQLKIITTFRHPYRRFFSALTLIFNRDMEYEMDTDMLTFSEYHLGEPHAMHGMCLPLIFSAYGYDVHFQYLSEYTHCLSQLYPKCLDLIEQADQPNPNDMSGVEPAQILTWLHYEKIIESEQFHCERYSSWEEWMDPELHLYNWYKKSRAAIKAGKSELCSNMSHDALLAILKNHNYWNDPRNTRLVSQLQWMISLPEIFSGYKPLENISSLASERLDSLGISTEKTNTQL